jgi:hypothetical protein
MIRFEPNLNSDAGSLFLQSDIQCTAMQQADVALIEVIATQQKDMPVEVTLSIKNEVKVRCDENDLLVVVPDCLMLAHNCNKPVVWQFLFFF